MRTLAHACALMVALAIGASACSSAESDRAGQRPAPAAAPATPPSAPPSAVPVKDARPRVVILGDSLTAGLGLDLADAYPTLLQQRIDGAGLSFQVVNAGVSGDTSAGGLSRLDWALDGNVRVLIVALGGNDALRALPSAELAKNLSTIIERAQARKIRVILAGMEAPPNFGRDYIVSFHQVYPDLAKKYQIAFIPFLLQGVAGIEALNQRDGIHPTPEGARLVADNVWSVLQTVLKTS